MLCFMSCQLTSCQLKTYNFQSFQISRVWSLHESIRSPHILFFVFLSCHLTCHLKTYNSLQASGSHLSSPSVSSPHFFLCYVIWHQQTLLHDHLENMIHPPSLPLCQWFLLHPNKILFPFFSMYCDPTETSSFLSSILCVWSRASTCTDTRSLLQKEKKHCPHALFRL